MNRQAAFFLLTSLLSLSACTTMGFSPGSEASTSAGARGKNAPALPPLKPIESSTPAAPAPSFADVPTPSAPMDLTATIAPGQCWVQTVIHPLPKQNALPIVVQEGTKQYEVKPAQLAKTTQEVIVREGGTTYRIEPPVYEAVKEKVLVKPEVRRTIPVPPVYEERSETVVIEAEKTVLERCKIPGMNQQLERAAQPLCARSLPAKTKTIKRRVLVQPATTREEVIPAEYKEVTRWVMVRPARAVPVEIPPTKQKIAALTIAHDEEVTEREIPPKVVEIVSTLYEGEPRAALRQAVCDADLTPDLVKAVQQKLKAAGYDPGPIDGKLAMATSRALIAYQRDHGLAAGALTLETLEQLGVSATVKHR